MDSLKDLLKIISSSRQCSPAVCWESSRDCALHALWWYSLPNQPAEVKVNHNCWSIMLNWLYSYSCERKAEYKNSFLVSLGLFSSGQSLMGARRAFRGIMLYCLGRTLCRGALRCPKCILVQAGLSQFCTFLGTILQDVGAISVSWPRLNIYTLVLTCLLLL